MAASSNTFAGVGRNAPCPCGSGKRYKSCHGNVAGAPPSAAAAGDLAGGPASDPRPLLLEGLALQQRGQNPQARKCYERVLAIDAMHPDAWHLLALLDVADGDPDAALDKVQRAIATLPEHAAYHVTLARIQIARGKTEDAERAARAAVQRAPENPEAWTVLGGALAERDFAACADALQRAIQFAPGAAEPHFLLGNAQRRSGDSAAAVATLRAALSANPDHPGLLNNLALACEEIGQRDAALAHCRQAIAAHPTLPEAHANLGNLLFAQGRYGEAAAAYRSAATLGFAPAQLEANLGIALQKQGELDAALACFERASAANPDHAGLRMNIGTVLAELKRVDAALPHFAAVLAANPDDAGAEAQLLHASQVVCRWSDYDGLVAARLARVRAAEPPAISPFTLLSIPATPEDQFRAACAYAHKALPHASEPAPVRGRTGRLRVGYLSSDLRRHPVGAAISELLERHDRSRLEVFAYAHGPRDAGPERRRIVDAVEHWRDVAGDSDAEVIRRIRDDRIDVLLDLNGYTQHERKEIAAARPAPVQIAFLGYPGTSGSEAFDFVLTDGFVSPPEQQRNFTERFLCLPNSLMPGDTRRTINAQPAPCAAYGLPESGFVFCAFTNPVKIIPPVFDLWMRLLHAVPGSVLWLRAGGTADGNLRREATRRGVAADRLVFAQNCPDAAEHLARHRLADLFLDTFPYNAHSTANDALFAGLPLLTCSGETFASRVAGSQLHAIGLPELVTHSLADYEALALRLAREPGLLSGLRARLAANRDDHPLFDMAGYARDFEDALFAAWNEMARAGGAAQDAADR